MFTRAKKTVGNFFKRVGDFNWNSFIRIPMNSKRRVTPKNSLAYAVVYACVNLISSDLATLPFGVFKDVDTGKIKDRTHDQYFLLKKKPHEHLSKFTYLKTLVVNFLLWGNGYAKIIRHPNSGRPTAYQIKKPNYIEPFYFETPQGKELFYKDFETGEIIHYMDMIHIADLSFNGIRGFSKIAIATESIDLGKSAIEFSNQFLDNGAHMSGYISLESKLTPKGQKKLSQSFMNAYGGRSNAGKIGVLEQGAKFEPFKYTMPLADAEILDGRKFQVEEMARFFNVPPHKIGHLQKSSFNNIEQQNIEYVQNTLNPIAVLIEMEHDRKVFRAKEEATHFTKLELKGLLRGDVKARTEFYKTLMDRAVLSPNDVLRIEDMPTYEGGEVKFLPLNMVSIENFDNPDFRKSGSKKKEKALVN